MSNVPFPAKVAVRAWRTRPMPVERRFFKESLSPDAARAEPRPPSLKSRSNSGPRNHDGQQSRLGSLGKFYRAGRYQHIIRL